MKLQPALVFGSHMVLQRKQPIVVWGKGTGGDTITVTLGTDSVSTPVIGDSWKAELPAREAETGLTMTIRAQKSAECITFCDVAIGEVWLAGGQSNMEFRMKYDSEASSVLPTANDPLLRCFDFPEASGPLQLQIGRFEDYGFWRTWDPENAPWFCAVGYWFAAQLRKTLNVPVGILACNWGGTVASAWTSTETLQADPVFQPILDLYTEQTAAVNLNAYYSKCIQDATADPGFSQEISEIMLMGGSLEDLLQSSFLKNLFGGLDPAVVFQNLPKDENGNVQIPGISDAMIGPMSANAPGALYESMVKQVAPYGVRGILWYQGESDDEPIRAPIYDHSLKALHSDWCKLWGKELPMLQVMLAPYHHWIVLEAKEFPTIREKQMLVADEVPNIYVANIMDHGREDNIHPRDKRWAGERLSRLARKYVYGEEILADSPSMEAVVWSEGKAVISFKNAEGLHLTGENIDSLELLQDGTAVPFCAKLEGETIVITSEAITSDAKLELRYAWQNYCTVNCYNAAELPVFPFKTEK